VNVKDRHAHEPWTPVLRLCACGLAAITALPLIGCRPESAACWPLGWPVATPTRTRRPTSAILPRLKRQGAPEGLSVLEGRVLSLPCDIAARIVNLETPASSLVRVSFQPPELLLPFVAGDRIRILRRCPPDEMWEGDCSWAIRADDGSVLLAVIRGWSDDALAPGWSMQADATSAPCGDGCTATGLVVRTGDAQWQIPPFAGWTLRTRGGDTFWLKALSTHGTDLDNTGWTGFALVRMPR
jgi:hypothetical protein